MYSQSSVVGKPYSKAQVREIERLFSILGKARHSDSVNAYTKKVLAGLKA